MTQIMNTNDPNQVIRELVERIEKLERMNPLTHASIDSGEGVAVYLPAGLHVEDNGSVKSGGVTIDNVDGGRVKAGESTYVTSADGGKLMSGGTEIDSGGKIGRTSGAVEFKSGMTTTGGITAEGIVYGMGGVRTPWGNGTALVKAIMEGIQSTADGASIQAQNVAELLTGTRDWLADVDAEASSAKAGVNDLAPRVGTLENQMGTKAGQTQVTNIATEVGQLKALVDQIKSVFNGHVDNYHPGGQKVTG